MLHLLFFLTFFFLMDEGFGVKHEGCEAEMQFWKRCVSLENAEMPF
jgi:hypothetical protein